MADPTEAAVAAVSRTRTWMDRDVSMLAENAKFRTFMADRSQAQTYTSFRSGKDLLGHLQGSGERYQQARTDAYQILLMNGWDERFTMMSIRDHMRLESRVQEAWQTVKLMQQHMDHPSVLVAGCEALGVTMLSEGFAFKPDCGMWKMLLRILDQHCENEQLSSTALFLVLRLNKLDWRSSILTKESTIETISKVVHSHNGHPRIVCIGLVLLRRASSLSPARQVDVLEKIIEPALAAHPEDPWVRTGVYYYMHRCLVNGSTPELETRFLDAVSVEQLLGAMHDSTGDASIFRLQCLVLGVLVVRMAKDGEKGQIQGFFPQVVRLVAAASKAIAASENMGDPNVIAESDSDGVAGVVSQMLCCISVTAAMPLKLQGDEDHGQEFSEIVRKADNHRYGWLSFAQDTLLPSADLFIDTIGLFSYVYERQFQFLIIILLSMVFNAVSTTGGSLFMDPDIPRWKLVLNFCTFGLFSILCESVRCSANGAKNNGLYYVKSCEAIESMTSLCVGCYSLLIAGYVEGYPPLALTTVGIRLVGIAISLVTLPLAAYSISRNAVDLGVAGDCIDLFRSNVKAKRSCCGLELPTGCAAMFAYHVCDLCSLLSLVVLQLAMRGVSIFIVLFTQLSIWLAVCRCTAPRSVTEFREAMPGMGGQLWVVHFGLTGLAATPPPGDAPAGVHFYSRVTALTRLATLVVVWAVIIKQATSRPNLVAHLEAPQNMVFMLMVAAGSLGFPITLAQQWRAGRFSSEPTPPVTHAGKYQQIPLTSDEADV